MAAEPRRTPTLRPDRPTRRLRIPRLPGRRRRYWLPLALLLAGLAALQLLDRGGPGDGAIAGLATVTDGDTLRIGDHRIRLEGIDAPESRQTCERGGQPWACGAEATRALREHLHGRRIGCTAADQDRYGRIVARCHDGAEDIAAWMVREGWAVAYTRFTWRYMPEEIAARWHRRGLWAGTFATPEDWRREHAR